MEAVRPLVDAYLLTLFRWRALSRRGFAETRRGDCRILPPLAQELATTTTTWRDYVAPVVERVASTVADHAPADFAVPTSLSGRHRRVASQSRGLRKARATRLPS